MRLTTLKFNIKLKGQFKNLNNTKLKINEHIKGQGHSGKVR